MTGSIKRRVCHLGDTADYNAIERTLCIEVRAAAALDWTVILGEQRLAVIRVAYRTDCIVRAGTFTHAAATAGIRETLLLHDDWTCNMLMHRVWLTILGNRDGLRLNLDLNGLEGADCHTAAAECTALCIILYFPRQIIDADILCLYCFHLCTSSSLSITTTSRSFG